MSNLTSSRKPLEASSLTKAGSNKTCLMVSIAALAALCVCLMLFGAISGGIILSGRSVDFTNLVSTAGTPSVTLLPQPVVQRTIEARPGWHTSYSEPFLSNVNNWNISANQPVTDEYGTCTERIGDGRFRIEKKAARDGTIFRWPNNFRPFKDFTLEVDVKHLSGRPDKSHYG